MSAPRLGPLVHPATTCRSCEAPIVFLLTRSNKRMPVNVEPTEDGFRAPRPEEREFVYGEHQSHFQTCPKASRFRGVSRET